MADQDRLTEAQLHDQYVAASRRFAAASGWREYLALAETFREMDTYKDASQMYDRCVSAASAPAYREVTESIERAETLTAEQLWEAAAILQQIQGYRDAREVMRVYTLKGNALAYEEAVALVSDADATTEQLERGVELLRAIKTYKDARDLLERYEKYYFERMYAAGMLVMENGHVYSEFEEAAAIFDRIAAYSDASAKAAACRKRAAKLRPKAKKAAERPAGSGASAVPADESDTAVRTGLPRRRRVDDETRNAVSEVYRAMDKRYLVWFIFWAVFLVLDVYASIVLPALDHPFVVKYGGEIRGVTALIAILAAVMTVRTFLRMLTASMRQKLREAALRALKKLAAPLVRAVGRLLASIGIDPSRRRTGGRDEKTFVFHDEEEERKKTRKRLKNDQRWQDQPDNAARVRFIFIDYMIRRIKGGYPMKRTMTPAEMGKDLATEADEACLFAAYDKARYGGQGAAEELTDTLVAELRQMNQK